MLETNEQPLEPQQPTGDPGVPRFGGVALLGAIGTMVVCSTEMVPGWRLIGLGWERSTYYLVVAIAGALAGMILSQHRLLGSVSGALALLGALFSTAFVLDHVEWAPKVVLVFAGGIGALPGLLFHGLCLLARQRLSGQSDDQVENSAERQRTP